MQKRKQLCANCRFFSQDVDPENRLYFDAKSGECRSDPPIDHFTWRKTRPYHWCGRWQAQEKEVGVWLKTSAHPGDSTPVLLFSAGNFCKQSGMLVGYWNETFKKWHDDGDQLLEKEEITNWMHLPALPKY